MEEEFSFGEEEDVGLENALKVGCLFTAREPSQTEPVRVSLGTPSPTSGVAYPLFIRLQYNEYFTQIEQRKAEQSASRISDRI